MWIVTQCPRSCLNEWDWWMSHFIKFLPLVDDHVRVIFLNCLCNHFLLGILLLFIPHLLLLIKSPLLLCNSSMMSCIFQISHLAFPCKLKVLMFSFKSFLFQFGPFEVPSLHQLDDLLEGVYWISRFIAAMVWFTAMANLLPLGLGLVIGDGLPRAKGVFPNYLIMIMCPVYTWISNNTIIKDESPTPDQSE